MKKNVECDDTYIDLSIEDNRRVFIQAAKDMDTLSFDGDYVTGRAPILYIPDVDPS